MHLEPEPDQALDDLDVIAGVAGPATGGADQRQVHAAGPRIVDRPVAGPKRQARQAARLALVEEHVRLENQHDLEGIMSTFGASARYDEEPWGDHHIGCDAVRAYYDGLLRAMPDLAIEVRRRHVAEGRAAD